MESHYIRDRKVDRRMESHYIGDRKVDRRMNSRNVHNIVLLLTLGTEYLSPSIESQSIQTGISIMLLCSAEVSNKTTSF